MCLRLYTGESNNFYFGIFICIGPLRTDFVNAVFVDVSQLTKLTV